MTCPKCNSVNISNHDETYYCYDCEYTWFPSDHPPTIMGFPIKFSELLPSDEKPVIVFGSLNDYRAMVPVRPYFLPDGTVVCDADGDESYTE